MPSVLSGSLTFAGDNFPMKTLYALSELAMLTLPVYAKTATVTVTKTDCSHIVTHTPDA